jgi:gliotoxin/aspirochlorine biosynthesis peptide synthetase
LPLDTIPQIPKLILIMELDESQYDVVQLFCQQVNEHPNNTAILSDGLSLSYSMLDIASSTLAIELISKGTKKGDIVVVLASRTVTTAVFFLACLKARLCYVPLEPESMSESYIHDIILTVCPRFILTEIRVDYGLEAITKTESDLVFSKTISEDLSSVPIYGNPSDLIYIIYTSGTTSKPKGVMTPRRAISNYVQQGGKDLPFNMNVTCDDTVLLMFSPAFDGK